MKKTMFVLLSVLMFVLTLSAENGVLLPDLVNPGRVVVYKNRLYVAEYEKIYVYDLKTFKRIVRFGKKGEGPGEFTLGRRNRKDFLTITPVADKLAISSRNKISFFSRKGNFLYELKMTSGFTRRIQPFKEFFISRQFRGMRENKPYQAITLFDSDLKKIREIYKHFLKIEFRRGRGRNTGTINEFDDVFGYAPGEDKVFVFDNQDFDIKIVDASSNKIGSIKIDYQPVKLTSAIKKNYMDHYKNVSYKDNWERVRNRIELPDYFPAIHSLHFSEMKLYVQTYKLENGKVEFYRFNSVNKLEKKISLPLIKTSIREFYPYCIHGSTLYQIVEDEDDEQWYLVIHHFD